MEDFLKLALFCCSDGEPARHSQRGWGDGGDEGGGSQVHGRHQLHHQAAGHLPCPQAAHNHRLPPADHSAVVRHQRCESSLLWPTGPHPLTNLNAQPFITQSPSHQPWFTPLYHTVTLSAILIHTPLSHSYPLSNLNSHPFITHSPSHQPSIPLYDIVTLLSTLIHTLWHSHPLTNLNAHPFITQSPSHQPSIPLYHIVTLSSTFIHTPLSQSPSYQPFIHTPLSHSHPLINRPHPFITVTLSSTIHIPLSHSHPLINRPHPFITVTLSSTIHIPLSQSPSHQPSTSLYHTVTLSSTVHIPLSQSPSHQPSTSLYHTVTLSLTCHSHPCTIEAYTELCLSTF